MDVLEKLYEIVVSNKNIEITDTIKEAIIEIKKLRNKKDLENQFMRRFMAKN